MPFFALDWTAVTVALIAAVGSVASSVIGGFVVWQLRTPSHKRIGEAVEKTYDLAATANMAASKLLTDLGGEPGTADE